MKRVPTLLGQNPEEGAEMPQGEHDDESGAVIDIETSASVPSRAVSVTGVRARRTSDASGLRVGECSRADA
jgi:hypothetical protein